MARPLRIEYAGALYHVTSRGDGREEIYFQDDDRTMFLGVLEEVCRRFNWMVYVYCLMGNRGFLSALERLVAKGFPKLRLGQVFFCAPDEDVRRFEDKTTEFPHQFENCTLLVSANDQAIALSKWKHKHDRVGIVPPVINFPNIETIEVGGFGLLDLDHSYFASAESVIRDIREAIETGKRARDRTIPQSSGDHFAIDILRKPIFL